MLQKRKLDYPKCTIPAPTGTNYLNTYTLSTKKGKLHLEKSGKKNIYDMIQADLENSKIENIIKRALQGDLHAFKDRPIEYVDTSTMPKDLMHVQNIIVKAKEEFDKMPAEVRELFHNSPEEYVNEMGTKKFIEKIEPYNTKMAKIAAEKNAAEYEKKVKEGAKLNYDIAREQKALEGGNQA